MSVTSATVPITTLRKFSPFHLLNEEQLQQLAPLAHIETHPKGSFIIKRGKELLQICYLISGQVDLVDAAFEAESVIADASHEENEDLRHFYPLTYRSPSTISAMAKSEVQLLVVDCQTYETAQIWSDEQNYVQADSASLYTESGYSNNQDWMVYLLDSPLFAKVPPMQLQQLFTRFAPVEVAAGEQIIKEGTDGDYFYVMESGRAQVKTLVDGVIAELSAGNFFGEEALVGDSLRNATVEMLESGIVMRLDKDDFKNLLRDPLIQYIDVDRLNLELGQPQSGEAYRLLDVRLPIEYRKIHVKDSANVPLFSLRKRLTELDQETVYVITDDAGKRSEVAAHLLCQAGFTTYILEDSHQHYLLASN